MTEQFDPYHKWLGIPPKDQPPNHYRLLGVEKFETDREVIDGAANRLMAYLQDLSIGESAAPAQRILNQISAVRLVLLNPAKKDAYDRQLQAESVPMARPVSPRTPPPMAPPAAPLAATPPTAPAQPTAVAADPFVITDDEPAARRGSARRRGAPAHKARKDPSYAPIILLAIAALAVAALATYVLTRPSPAAPPLADELVVVERPGPPPAVSDTRLRIDIAEQDRSGVAISIDRKKREVAQTGQIAFDLAPGPHTVVIRRRGFLTIDRDIDIVKGATSVLKANWKVDKDARSRANQFDIPAGAMDDLGQAKPAERDDDSEKKPGEKKPGEKKPGEKKPGDD
jgi:hypothetical protein